MRSHNHATAMKNDAFFRGIFFYFIKWSFLVSCVWWRVFFNFKLLFGMPFPLKTAGRCRRKINPLTVTSFLQSHTEMIITSDMARSLEPPHYASADEKILCMLRRISKQNWISPLNFYIYSLYSLVPNESPHYLPKLHEIM